MKRLLFASIASLCVLLPFSSKAAPRLGYGSVATPYGVFGCRLRAENKLYSIGATGLQKSGNTIWADYGSHSVGIWCRGDEVVIFAAGSSETLDLINDIRSAF